MVSIILLFILFLIVLISIACVVGEIIDMEEKFNKGWKRVCMQVLVVICGCFAICGLIYAWVSLMQAFLDVKIVTENIDSLC